MTKRLVASITVGAVVLAALLVMMQGSRLVAVVCGGIVASLT